MDTRNGFIGLHKQAFLKSNKIKIFGLFSPGFVITGVVHVLNMDFEPIKWKNYVFYNWQSLLTELATTKFDCIQTVI